MEHRNSDHATLWELIKDIRFGMLTHRHPDGMLYSHPLTTQNQSFDQDSTLYFFISAGSEIAAHIGADNMVNVSYADPGADSYVSVSGTGTIVDDQPKKAQLWTPMAKVWFPKGPTDPDLALLEVRIVHAEYWDTKTSKVVQLFKMARAAMRGEQPRDIGEHKELHLS